MKKEKKFPKKLIFLLFILSFILIRGLKLIINGGGMYVEEWIDLSYFLWGVIGGIVTLFIDRLVDVYISNPETELAIWTKKLIDKRRYKEAIKLIKNNADLQTKLTLRSVLFQVIWCFLAIFTIFSTNSLFAIGFILGMGLWLVLIEWEDYLVDKKKLKKWLFWQINEEFSDNNLKKYLIFVTIFWAMCFLRVMY